MASWGFLKKEKKNGTKPLQQQNRVRDEITKRQEKMNTRNVLNDPFKNLSTIIFFHKCSPTAAWGIHKLHWQARGKEAVTQMSTILHKLLSSKPLNEGEKEPKIVDVPLRNPKVTCRK